MKHVEKRIARMVDELVTFFTAIGGDDISIRLTKKEDQYMLQMTSTYDPAMRKKVDNLYKTLNAPKNQGLEEFYWELAGESAFGHDSELHLIGQMIDSAQIDIEDGLVSIRLYKSLK